MVKDGIFMNKFCIGDEFQIQCYKHNGKIHRAWSEAVLLDVKKDYMVFGNKKTQVIEAEGSCWKTKEPAVMYFFKHHWFNIIAQLKKDGVSFYCNIATPFIIEDGTIKYIDYDLDLRIFPSGEYKILDKLEYQYHQKLMNYSDELNRVIVHAMDELIQLYEKGSQIFDSTENMKYYQLYESIREEEKNSNF